MTKKAFKLVSIFFVIFARHDLLNPVVAWSLLSPNSEVDPSRRSMLTTTVGFAGTLFNGLTALPTIASATTDCLKDCIKNCKQIVPNDTSKYCQITCTDYCEQTDRRDGLSGSVSSEGGEVGILGGTFGTGTVVKGEDKPPSIDIPGLDFKSREGKKLIGL